MSEINEGCAPEGDRSVTGNPQGAPASSRWQRQRLPSWLRQPLSKTASSRRVEKLLRAGGLNTICEEARCPNRNHCYSRGTATFLILGDACTRSCPFCSVAGGPPLPPDPEEPRKLVEAAVAMDLKHVVITSVNRDDLPDQGSGHFVECIDRLREEIEGICVEVLIPDFRGRNVDIDRVLDAGPDILNHNIETVGRLYRSVRPGSRYQRSLDLLQRARKGSEDGKWVKSGLMLGLGEESAEVDELLLDLHRHGVQMITIGQYLQPTPQSLPVIEYIEPAVFDRWQERGIEIGFDLVFAGPFVRSSYMADAQVPLP